ncbi:hypothetical protein BST61_g10170 [Cercospora zeina]
MLPRALTRHEAAILFNTDKSLTTDETIQLADWYPNSELANRANRSIVNRGGNSQLENTASAGGGLDRALIKRAEAQGHPTWDMRVSFRIRRKESHKIKYGEDHKYYKLIWKRKQQDDASALAQKHGVGVLSPALASGDGASSSNNHSDSRVKFDPGIFDDIRNFEYQELEATTRKEKLGALWHKLVKDNDTALTASNLALLVEPRTGTDAFKRAVTGLPEHEYRALRIVWLVTLVDYVLQIPDAAVAAEGKDGESILERLLQATRDFSKRPKTLRLLPIATSVGIDYSIVYGHHILSQLYPGVSYHLHLALFVKDVMRHDKREYDAMQQLVNGQELSDGALPQSETSLQSFMATVTTSAMETWLRSPMILEERVPLFENMRIAAGMRFDPPLFDGAPADDKEGEEMDGEGG